MRGQRSSASSAAIRGSQRTHCALRQIRTRPPRPRPHPLEGRNRQTRLRECLQRRLENVARALKNGHERIPPESRSIPIRRKSWKSKWSSFSSAKAPNSPKATSRKEAKASRADRTSRVPSPDVSLTSKAKLQKDRAATSGAPAIPYRRRPAGSFDFFSFRLQLR